MMRRAVDNVEVDDFDYLFKIVLIGDAGVGKSALVHRFRYNTFVGQQASTIGVDFIIRSVTIDGKKIKLQIWDTAGQERFRTITQGYYRAAHAVIVVYDITLEKTFQKLPMWLKDVDKFAHDCKIRMLIGNKADIKEDRMVPKDKALAFSKCNSINEFLETSAKDSTNVEELFMRTAELLKKKFEQGYLKTTQNQQTQILESRHITRWGCCS